jgi:hypothetical protein
MQHSGRTPADCLKLAERNERMAEETTLPTRDLYLEMAATWRWLAQLEDRQVADNGQ